MGIERDITRRVATNVTSRIVTRLDRRDRVQPAVLAYETGLVRPGSTATP